MIHGKPDLEQITGPIIETNILTSPSTPDLRSESSNSNPVSGIGQSTSNNSSINQETNLSNETTTHTSVMTSFSSIVKATSSIKPATLIENSEVISTSGQYDEQLASLEVQKASFFNSQHFPSYYNIIFPGIDLNKDVNGNSVEREITQKIGPTKKISKVNRNTLLVQITSSKQITSIQQLKTVANHPITTSLDPHLSFAKAIVQSKVMSSMTEQELKEKLTSQGVINWVKLGQSSSHTYLLTFRSSEAPALIRLSSFQCVITKPYAPSPMRCKKCQKIGHTKNQCRSKTEHCRTCCQPDHATCDGTPFCINCGESHPPSSDECPHFLMRKRILHVQATQRIPFREAKAIIRVNYAQNQQQYNFDSVKLPTRNPTLESTNLNISSEDLNIITESPIITHEAPTPNLQQIQIEAEVHNSIETLVSSERTNNSVLDETSIASKTTLDVLSAVEGNHHNGEEEEEQEEEWQIVGRKNRKGRCEEKGVDGGRRRSTERRERGKDGRGSDRRRSESHNRPSGGLKLLSEYGNINNTPSQSRPRGQKRPQTEPLQDQQTTKQQKQIPVIETGITKTDTGSSQITSQMHPSEW